MIEKHSQVMSSSPYSSLNGSPPKITVTFIALEPGCIALFEEKKKVVEVSDGIITDLR